MSDSIRVLDHGFVRLHNFMGNDLEIARAARQSYNAAWRAGENEGSDAKLIRYLWKNKHSTPFEAVEFSFEIKAPIFVLRQWQRHRTWDFFTVNEVSARYKQLPAEFYAPEPEMVGVQSAINKQGRDLSSGATFERRVGEVASYKTRCEASFREYKVRKDPANEITWENRDKIQVVELDGLCMPAPLQ